MKILEEKNSKINGNIKVVKSFGFGTYIQVEGLTQSGGIVESIWKRTLRKVKSNKPQVTSCLILGLGGGSAAKIVKKFWPETKVTGVEIDPTMAELGKKYLDLKVNKIYIGGAERFVLETKNKHDLILVDTYLGDKFPEKLQEVSFLKILIKKINKDGVVVFNRLYYGGKRSEAVKFGEKLKKVFSSVEYFYPEANLMFVCKA